MLNIIIADDETIERMTLKQTLAYHYAKDFDIYEATNGREAIQLAASIPLHIAVMDISMPGINGIDAASEILKQHPSCKIIFLTAYEDFNYAKQAISLHAVDYLLKPCSDEELINAVDMAIHFYNAAQLQPIPIPSTTAEEDETLDTLPLSAIKSEFEIQTIVAYIKSNFHKNLSLHDFAKKFGYSDVYFSKFFKNNFNVNFTTYITNLRIEEAKRLLVDTSTSIKTISNLIGYSDSNYFAKVFKHIVKPSPSEYRTRYGK